MGNEQAVQETAKESLIPQHTHTHSEACTHDHDHDHTHAQTQPETKPQTEPQDAPQTQPQTASNGPINAAKIQEPPPETETEPKQPITEMTESKPETTEVKQEILIRPETTDVPPPDETKQTKPETKPEIKEQKQDTISIPQTKPKIKQTTIFEEKTPMDVKEKIEEYFHTSYPINITQDVFNTKDGLLKLRRYFHANPELSFKEYKTSENIVTYCESLGLATKSGIGKGTGVIAVLHGGGDNLSDTGDTNVIALRADMDALPIEEENTNIGYKSRNKGIMHACGHDCHMAILLTVARILSQPKYVSRINGIIKFIFQPGEEGGAGAKYMIEDSVLDNDKELNCPAVNSVYGLHVWSYNKLGKIVLRSGPLMAGSQYFKISVKGVGGHGAQPLNTCDSVLAITALNIQLHSIVSRNISPIQSGVVSIGTCEVGEGHNIIAENGHITGTIRYLNEETYEVIRRRVKEICKGIECSYNVSVALEWGENPYPPVINEEKSVNNVRRAVDRVFPNAKAENIIVSNKTTMAAEDFSFYLNKVEGCFFFVGCGIEECEENDSGDERKAKKIYAHHTPHFKVDERSLLIGVQIFVNLVMDLLATK